MMSSIQKKHFSILLNSGQHYTRREAIIKVNFKDIHVDYTVSQLNSNKPYHPLLLIEINPIDRDAQNFQGRKLLTTTSGLHANLFAVLHMKLKIRWAEFAALHNC